MPSEETRILEFNQYRKFDKVLFLKSLIGKFDGCGNNPEKLYRQK